MQPYIELNAHHIGKSHVQNGLACEDYSAVYSDDQINIVVISDGHGDKNCFRSAKGARYACEIAINACRQFQSFVNQIVDITTSDFEGLVTSLESNIVELWREKVLSDANAHPFQEEELSIASDQAQNAYRTGQRFEKAYGCTLILAMSTEHFWLTLQIGDGKCVAAYRDGVFVEPIPVDENCLGNRSTSLCNSNAKEFFHHYYSPIKPVAAFVFSDGVEESFDQVGLYNCLYSVAFWLKEEGFETAKTKLEALLPQVSEGGSGDDVSIATMVSTTDVIAKPRQTLHQIYERVNACTSALEQCNTCHANMKDRLIDKTKECNEAREIIAKIKADLEEKEKVYEKTVSDKQALVSSVDELVVRVQRATEQMEKASKYKIAAERYWFAELERLGLKELSVEEVHVDAASSEIAEDSHLEKREKLAVDEASAPETITKNDYSAQTTADVQESSHADTHLNETEYHPAGCTTADKPLEVAGEQENGKPVKRFWPFSKQSR